MGDDHGRFCQQSGEWPNNKINVINGNQCFIIGGDFFGAAIVFQDDQLDRASEQPTIFVDRVRPELVSLLNSWPIGIEVSRNRYRESNFNGW